MFLYLAVFVLILWGFLRNLGIISSWLLSAVLRCPLEVGSVGWCRLSDVRLRLPTGLLVHVDICQLQLSSTLISKPLLLSLGDVRVEGDAHSLAQASSTTSRSTSTTSNAKRSIVSRVAQMVQYCGLYINSGHLVLLDALPGCMIHVTVDELLVEDFRSRESWQLEVSCRLARGKAMLRRVATGHSLLDVALQFRLSLDVAGGRLINVRFRVEDPTIDLSSGVFTAIERQTWSPEPSPSSEEVIPLETNLQQKSSFIADLSDLNIELNNCVIKYNGAVADESRTITLSLRGLSVVKDGEKVQGRITGLTIEDQGQRSSVRTSLLVLSHEIRTTGINVQISSDSVQTKVSVQDVVWWKLHVEESIMSVVGKAMVPSKSVSQNRLPMLFAVELASISCDLVDLDSFQSTLSVQFFSIIKTIEVLEIGVDCLCISAPYVNTSDATFERHQWGHSLFIGAALVQYTVNGASRGFIIGVDDCKIEWSDKLAEQIKQLSDVISTNTSQNQTSPLAVKTVKIRFNMKRAAVISVVKDSFYLTLLLDEIESESELPRCVAVTARQIRLVSAPVHEMFVDLMILRSTSKFIPPSNNGWDAPWRCWNQAKNDAHKNNRAAAWDEQRMNCPQVCFETAVLCVTYEVMNPAISDVTCSSSSLIYLVWSPLLHRILYHMGQVIVSTFLTPRKGTKSPRKSPRQLQYRLLTNQAIELVLELPRHHRMTWRVPSITFEASPNLLSAAAPKLVMNMDGLDIVTATDVSITRRKMDTQMEAYRRCFKEFELASNKVWTWAASSFLFYLPFEFNFAQVFDEFVNAVKWIKIVHGLKSQPFPPNAPLPADIRIIFKEARLELEDDPFENLLQMSHELKEDEVYECERRRQMLSERLLSLKKSNPLMSQARVDELFALLLEKNSAIYVERWNKAGNIKRPLFTSKWVGLEVRAFADPYLHGHDRCVELMQVFDPLSMYPRSGLSFSTLWGRGMEFDFGEWTVNFRDYPMPYLLAKDMHFFGMVIGAEEFEEGGRSLRECEVPLPDPWETHKIERNMSPLKFYYDMLCESGEYSATYGPCWEPCLSMVSLMWNNISAPSRDPSIPLPFWDKMRFLLHGRFSWLSSKVVTTMLASPDPYNTTETVEMCWDEFGLDWALGEIRIRCGLRVFMRTASRYDDSRILLLPDLKLRVLLEWICSGDPHDHHSVTLCAPHRLPHYSNDHDSYRAFRSSSLDLSLEFDVAAGSGNGDTGDRLPHVLLYANTFRCLEFLINTLTMKNRNVRKGCLFGTPSSPKPQLGKHFRNVNVALNFPKFYITYWMSHSSDYGFRLISDGLNLMAAVKLTVQAASEQGITRRRTYVWTPEHVSATLWGTKIHVYSHGHAPSVDGVSNDEATFLLGVDRVSYVRENNQGRESSVHRLTVHDLKGAWTAQNRDACINIADGVHRAHMLRRILSNDALKILKLHMEEEKQPSVNSQQAEGDSSKQEQGSDARGHRRGYSMTDQNQSLLTQLIAEASTKLVAHCEQATDLPTDSLLGVLQCTSDDVRLINWQIDLLNSQVVLKGCERAGFILITAARASVTQKVHRSVWRNGQLLGKKSWSAIVSGMQYFAPISNPDGKTMQPFRWLTKEVIEEKAPTKTVGDPYLHPNIGTGDAVGGVVDSKETSEEPQPQLQRIVSRCSCEIYFCYFSEEIKTDAIEETGVPKVEQERGIGAEETGVDCLTLKHNMLEATSNSEQYEIVVDIVNNLVLYVDPKKKELAERRRKLRFACQMINMKEMRERIVEQQCELREIVSVVRSLERQLFFLDTQSKGEVDEQKRRGIVEEMENIKAKQLEVSDKLAIYISCYKQRQVDAARAIVVSKLEEEDAQAAVARRFEVCFEDCIWNLTESDGQISIAQIQIRNFLYTRTMRIDSSGEHLFEVGTIRVTNLLPDTIYKDTLHRDERVQTRQPSLRLTVRDMAPVGGICVKELFEVNIAPMVAQLTYRFFEKMMLFFFPGRNIHKEDNLDSIEENTSKIQKFSFTRRFAGTLSMRSSKSAQIERKPSNPTGKSGSGKQTPEAELTDIDKMRERADNNNFFLYIKIPEVPFVVSYKGNKEKNIEDVDRFSFLFPLCEFHERNWTWLDVALAVKQRCKRVLLQQFMRQKLLRNRLTGGPETVEGFTEEDKKRIALGSPFTGEKKKKK